MKDKLTLKQKMFCKYYMEGSGNGTEAVIKAGYNVANHNGTVNRLLAKSIASENLTKPDIIKHIQDIFESCGYNDNSILNQHLFLIKQNTDLSVKARAIDMYYKKTGAYTKVKQKNDFVFVYE